MGFRYDPFSGQFVPSSTGGGGGSNSYQVDIFTLTNTDITNKGVVLSAAPTVPSKVILTIASAPSQHYGIDFVIDSAITPNQTLDWNGLGLDGILASGDFLMVQYY